MRGSCLLYNWVHHCLFQADIPSEILLVYLEPEAAVMYCKAQSELPVNAEFQLKKYLPEFQDNIRYIIIDARAMLFQFKRYFLEQHTTNMLRKTFSNQ